MRTRKTKVGGKLETTVAPGPQAQVALVAMDPHTGEIKRSSADEITEPAS